MQKPSGTLVAAIKAVPESELSLFFRNLRDDKLAQVIGAQGVDALLKIQQQTLYITEIENIFRQMRDIKLSA